LQGLTGDTLAPVGLVEGAPELPFQQAIDAAKLLLLPELQAVGPNLAPATHPVLTGGRVATLDRALFLVTALALEEQLHALSAAQSTYGSSVSCHVFLFPKPCAACADDSRCAESASRRGCS
jgi:hypothetical protein